MGSRIRNSTGGKGGHEHPSAVATALNAFQTALTGRYLQVMRDAASWGFPTEIPGPAHLDGAPQQFWDYTTEAAKSHLNGYCRFMRWHSENEAGASLQGVTCESLFQRDAVYSDGSDHNFTCGMGEMFSAAYEWAWNDRVHILERIPSFATQDIDALKSTRDAYLNASTALGMDYADAGGWDTDGTFSLVGIEGTLMEVVEDAYTPDGTNASWMVGWTGAAAEAAATGFFHTTMPTLVNHARITGALGYLVNLRATIIDRNRANTLDLIDSATAALGEKRDVDLTGRWAVVQGIGMAVSLTGPGAVVGAPLTFVGWLGEKLYPEKKNAAFASEPHEVALGLTDAFDRMSMDIESSEADYRNEVGQVENEIGRVPLEALELYDITRNNPEGTAGKGGDFEVDIDVVTNLSALCYAIAEAYEEIRTQLRDIYDADPHLTDRDGGRTDGDVKVMSIREDLLNFVGTALGRYSLMGSQLEEAARAYAESDDSAARSFELWEDSMEGSDKGAPVTQSEAEVLAEATERNSTGPQDEYADDDIVYDSEGWSSSGASPEKSEG